MVPKQRSSESFSNLCLKFGKKFGENENTCVCVYIYIHTFWKTFTQINVPSQDILLGTLLKMLFINNLVLRY